ncbi:hypothetical protein E2P81_ATG04358 [Venturia nashicola]|nr:hypothetical protein E2P81_ATG04358 [Venturia nashicola]
MDWDESAELKNKADSMQWLQRFLKCRKNGLTTWVSTFHKGSSSPRSLKVLIRKDVDRGDIEKIYRQVAQIHLKLSKLNFSRIGSPSKSSNSKNIAHICSRPLTWKAHEILSSQTASFSSTTDYFKYVADQDLQHLYKQSNSVDDENDARKKYAYWNAFKALVPCLVSAEHEKGPFKLICDDFGPANMIVDNAQNLNIVAVIDWEWTYTGPYQLFWSPPRWLLIQPPNSWEDSDERLSIYHRYLELYIRILGEEEVRVLGADIHPEERPSKMMRQFRANGWMWFHHIIWGGFNGPTHIPFKELQASTADFDRLVAEVPQEDIDDFVKTKIDHLDWIRKHCHYE